MSNQKKELIRLVNVCYQCDDERNFSSPSALRRHLEAIHNTRVPARKITDRRPVSSTFEYAYGANDRISAHYACCSCFYHTDHMKRFQTHIIHKHNPKEIIHDSEDEEDSRMRPAVEDEEAMAEKMAQDFMKLLVEKLSSLMK